MPARALMFQGTGSDVGKSLIVAGLARALTLRGLKVRPFKPQNMSNNAAVTADGGEIGRAQALQARAARVPPSVHMNPVLLKPQSEIGAQIVVQGRVYGSAKAAAYQHMKRDLLPSVLDSYERLRARGRYRAGRRRRQRRRSQSARQRHRQYGLCARRRRAGRADRRHRSRRRHREPRRHQGRDRAGRCGADPRLHRQQIPRRSGAVRRRHGAHRATDRLAGARPGAVFCRTRGCCRRKMRWRSSKRRPAKPQARLRIAVPILPHIANFDDLDPLDAEPAVELVRVRPGAALPGDADLILLPGSKATIADLAALRAAGFDIDIAAHRRRGGTVLGLCGGYQMLGRSDRRSRRHRRSAGDSRRPRPASTSKPCCRAKSASKPVRGTTADGVPFSGYEMHMGVTAGPGSRAAVRAACRRFAGGRGFGRRPRDRHLYPRPVRRRSPARGVAGALRRRRDEHRLRGSRSSARSMRSRRISPRISISIALLKLAR